MRMQFECGSCGDLYEKDVKSGEQMPLIGLCDTCDEYIMRDIEENRAEESKKK